MSFITLYRFVNGFVPARSHYGIVASVHAWIEVPLVVNALTRLSQVNRTIPTVAEAALVTPETISARAEGSPITQAISRLRPA